MTISPEHQEFEWAGRAVVPGSNLLVAWPLEGGISVKMTALEMESPEGQIIKLVVRQYPNSKSRNGWQRIENEFQVLQLTQSLGLKAPAPRYLAQAGEIFAEPAMIVDYIDGQMNLSPSELGATIRQLATQLATIHDAGYSAQDLSFLPQGAEGCIELTRGQTAASNWPFDEVAIRETVYSAWPIAQVNNPTLLHGDFWPGNTLWKDGRLVAVIDWEDAEVGDPLLDFAKSRSEIVWIYGIDALNAFTNQYRSLMDLDYANLPYWDLCAALRQIRLAGSNLAGLAEFFVPYDRSDISASSIQYHLEFFIATAYEQLAFKWKMFVL